MLCAGENLAERCHLERGVGGGSGNGTNAAAVSPATVLLRVSPTILATPDPPARRPECDAPLVRARFEEGRSQRHERLPLPRPRPPARPPGGAADHDRVGALDAAAAGMGAAVAERDVGGRRGQRLEVLIPSSKYSKLRGRAADLVGGSRVRRGGQAMPPSPGTAQASSEAPALRGTQAAGASAGSRRQQSLS